MTKKEFGKKAWIVTKKGTSMGVGLAASVVSHTVCSRVMGEPVTFVDTFVSKAGIYGVDLVVGSVATSLTMQTIEAREAFVVKKIKEMKDELEEVEVVEA